MNGGYTLGLINEKNKNLGGACHKLESRRGGQAGREGGKYFA